MSDFNMKEKYESEDQEEELTEAEQIEFVKAISSILDTAELVLGNMQQKVFELNETTEVQMRNDEIELDNGEKHVIVSAFLPDSENEDYGWWIPMRSEKLSDEKDSKRRTPVKPEFWKYIHKVPYMKNNKFLNADEIRSERAKQKNSIDETLLCPMNALEEVLNDINLGKKEMFGNEPEIPMDDFCAHVEGRADSRQIQKIFEWAKEWKNAEKRYNIKKISAVDRDDLAPYIEMLEEQDRIRTEMKNSITKMNQKTMSQMLKFSMGAAKNVGIPEDLRNMYKEFGMEVLQLCYDYDKKMFLSCFKKSSDMKLMDKKDVHPTQANEKLPKKVRRSMNKTRKKAI